MPVLTREEKLKILEKLPLELQNLFTSEETAVFLGKTRKKFSIPDNRARELAKIVGDVILGLLPLTSLGTEINTKVTPDLKTALNLAQEITNGLFLKVINLLGPKSGLPLSQSPIPAPKPAPIPPPTPTFPKTIPQVPPVAPWVTPPPLTSLPRPPVPPITQQTPPPPPLKPPAPIPPPITSKPQLNIVDLRPKESAPKPLPIVKIPETPRVVPPPINIPAPRPRIDQYHEPIEISSGQIPQKLGATHEENSDLKGKDNIIDLRNKPGEF